MTILSLLFYLSIGAVHAGASAPEPGHVVALTAAAECRESLVEAEASHPGTMVIGALVRGSDGRKRLATGNYFAGAHQALILEALELFGVSQILWLGEARVSVAPKVLIHSANETSGFAGELSQGFVISGGLELPIPQELQLPWEDNYLNLPASILAPDFVADHFGEGRPHLADAFAAGHTNIRHAVVGGLTLVQQIRDFLAALSFMSLERKSAYIVENTKSSQSDFAATREVLAYMVGHGLAREEDVDAIERALTVLQSEQPSAAELEAISLEDLTRQIAKLTALNLRVYNIPN